MKWLSAFVLTAIVPAQQVDLSSLDKLAARAKSSVNVTLDEDKLKFASAFLSSDDPNQSIAKGVVGGLKGINVRVFEFDDREAFSLTSDLDPIRNQLRGSSWSRIIEARERDEVVEIYSFGKGKDVSGLVILAAEKRELTVVNITGAINLETLGSLAGKFGIPKDIMITPGPKPAKPSPRVQKQ